MIDIRILGNVKNTDIALGMIQSFTGEATDRADHVTSDERELDRLLSKLPENPNRNICLWLLDVTLEISAPASWWNQLRQYELDVFPVRHRSRSREGRQLLSRSDFEGSISEEKLAILNNYIRDGQYDTFQRLLPSNYIQRGLVKINYKTLSDILADRESGVDDHWDSFLEFIDTLPFREVLSSD
jgi:hypothetical protein